jgi:argininosuccinate lyase
VRLAIDTRRDLPQVGLEEFKRLSPVIGKDVHGALTVEGSLKARNHLGGTAPAQVKAAVKRARKRILHPGK